MLEEILLIISSLVSVVAICLGYYRYIRKKLETGAVDAINKAELTAYPGVEKMQYAVDIVYNIVPAVLKPFFSRDVIEVMIQGVFDKMEEYARQQIKDAEEIASGQ
jgi:hypothetical protein